VFVSCFFCQLNEKEQAQENWRLWKAEMYGEWLKAARKKSLLSRPKRPPRPYDYSKEDRYITAGMLYIPKKKWVSAYLSRRPTALIHCHEAMEARASAPQFLGQKIGPAFPHWS